MHLHKCHYDIHVLDYHIRQKNWKGKLSHLECKMVIHWKHFMVGCLQTYIVNQPGHNSWENIHNPWKQQKFYPLNVFPYTVFYHFFNNTVFHIPYSSPLITNTHWLASYIYSNTLNHIYKQFNHRLIQS